MVSKHRHIVYKIIHLDKYKATCLVKWVFKILSKNSRNTNNVSQWVLIPLENHK